MQKYLIATAFFAFITFAKPRPGTPQKTTTVVPPSGTNGSAVRWAFIAKYANEVVQACIGSGIYPSVVMVMAIYETGNGTSELSRNANNFFGIKKHSWTGAVYYAYDDCGSAKCAFRAYSSFTESAQDFVTFLQQQTRYSKAFTVTSARAQIDEIMKAGYAPLQYGTTAKQIMTDYKLTELDIYV